MAEEEQDFLEVDRPIPGQNFVCLSFISPENILEDKKLYTLYKYHLSLNEGCDLTFSQFKEQFEDFSVNGRDNLQKEFSKLSSAFNSWCEQIEEDFTEPVYAVSVKDIEKQITTRCLNLVRLFG